MMKNVIALTIVAASLALATPASAGPKKKKSQMPYKAAKAQCLEENPGMRGKQLKNCIKQKRAGAR